MGDLSTLIRVVLSLKAFNVCSGSRGSVRDGLVSVPGCECWEGVSSPACPAHVVSSARL